MKQKEKRDPMMVQGDASRDGSPEQMQLFDLSELLTDEEKEALEQQRIQRRILED
jgi:hypothetical protein